MSMKTGVKNVFSTRPVMQEIKKQRVDKRDVLEGQSIAEHRKGAA